ncbi:ATPase H(+)-transporting accessory protein 2 [Teleopsis dalmanni]|uniref:ATPase H(+)-transporting accessory protein 2 n=1 Tax=Teleopsis dalmanni TaxID=139649 RepID=UPI0018CF1508|nr:ATPase H(+)-transporting accessory protein 2 [Teleopsis dalmanni]
MLRNLLIFSLCVVAACASGEFSVLSSPKSLSFKGNDILQSAYVNEVFSASVGYPITGVSKWSGLIIKDPFTLAKGVITVLVEGVDSIPVSSEAKTYGLQGDESGESLNLLATDLEANNVPICYIDFNRFDDAVGAYNSCFGENTDTSTVKDTKYLNPALHTADKQFLQTIGLINSAAEHLSSMQKPSNFVLIRLPLDSIAKAHGVKSEAMAEATKLISSTISNLNTAAQKSSNNEALVVAIASKNTVVRAKREAVTNTDNKYNLAEYYNQDYPVIFNIILWFMVTFGFALLAICYAIGSMDPGRDSIIYRMTSTRIKKDN